MQNRAGAAPQAAFNRGGITNPGSTLRLEQRQFQLEWWTQQPRRKLRMLWWMSKVMRDDPEAEDEKEEDEVIPKPPDEVIPKPAEGEKKDEQPNEATSSPNPKVSMRKGIW